MFFNAIVVIAMVVASVYTYKLWRLTGERPILLLLAAFLYAVVSRSLSLATSEGWLVAPSRELAIPGYILFGLGVIGLYRAVKRLMHR